MLALSSSLVSAGYSFSIHSIITWVSRNAPRRWNKRFPAFFIFFQSGSGSIAIRPSAIERQRRKATRRSCTGSALKFSAARSHSSSTDNIQRCRPAGFLAFLPAFFAGVGFVPLRSAIFVWVVAIDINSLVECRVSFAEHHFSEQDS